MTKATRPRNGNDVVRRDHLARLKAGAGGITHLVKTDDVDGEKRRELTNEVSEIGRQNRRMARGAAAPAADHAKRIVRKGTTSK